MTDNEIIKALECCIHDDYDYCEECPYLKNKPCHEGLIQDAFNLINRQKAEIERLETELGFAKAFRKETDAEFSLMHRKYGNMLKTAKAEAVKEFAERLKPRLGFGRYLSYDELDNLVKETVGEK